ncbi:hypothetical protein GUJ93_ZPchr0008g13113 [Zizania palustris]|uniref:Uncharacterized protein n=1 Tax=Zizania palustris TaxID=103762 RepID=A0A8J5RLG4_ZIZPA|nr:hypothetical protein GUJ93_ZPchr0008g13113 [Zizania palustris]
MAFGGGNPPKKKGACDCGCCMSVMVHEEAKVLELLRLAEELHREERVGADGGIDGGSERGSRGEEQR